MLEDALKTLKEMLIDKESIEDVKLLKTKVSIKWVKEKNRAHYSYRNSVLILEELESYEKQIKK